MAGGRNDPYGAFNFIVEIDGLDANAVAGFMEVSGLEAEVGVIEYREGGDPTVVRKLPGLRKYSNITLKRGYTDSRALYEWWKETVDGQTHRRNGSIILLNETREPAVRFNFLQGWPCRYSGPHFDAQLGAVAIETLEICHEGLQLAE